MSDLQILCPAGRQVSPPLHGPSVMCGVLEQSNDGAHAHGFQSRGKVSALISGRHDSATVREFCCGRRVPDGSKDVEAAPGEQASYTACRVWQAEKARIAAARKGPDGLHAPQRVERRRPAELDPEFATVGSVR